MNQTDTALIALAEISYCLSELYQTPDSRQLTEALQKLTQLSPYLNDESAKLIEQLFQSFQPDMMMTLQVDHAALFVGPYQLLAHPYGSVHLENNRQVMGETTAEVKQLYLNAGVDVSDTTIEVPDHICIELEFLQYLLYQLNESEKNELLDTVALPFITRYYLPFMNSFLDKVVAHAESDFYKTLGKLHRDFDLNLCSALNIDDAS